MTDDEITEAGKRIARALMNATDEEIARDKACFEDVPDDDVLDDQEDEG